MSSFYRLFISSFIFILCTTLVQAKVSITANRTVLNLNESLSVEIVQSETSGGRPDLSVFEKDFSIISQSQSQQYSIVNGRSSQKKVWSLNLMPKSSGEITIAPIRIGKEESNELHLVIHESQDQQPVSGQTANVFIKVDISPNENVYVQQKTTLTIQIFYRITLNNLALSELKIDKVIMEKIGEDKQFTKTIDQHTYQVIERRYALYPQESGTLTIPPIRFEAVATSSNRGRWPFFTQQGKSIIKQSNSLSIDVLAKPDSYTAERWLPAENIQVISEHSDLNNIHVGDSVTITDKIISKGISANILGDIPFKTIKNIKMYPEQAITENTESQDELYGIRQQKTALIATRPGRYTVPARELIWWNTSKNKMEKKIIPSFSFNVLAPEDSNFNQVQQDFINFENQANKNSTAKKKELNQPETSADAQLPISTATPKVPPPFSASSGSATEKAVFANYKENSWFWIWLATISIAIIIIILLTRSLRKNSGTVDESNNSQATIEANRKEEEKQLLNELSNSAKQNQAKQSYAIFLKWAMSHFQTQNFNESKLHFDEELKSAITDLENNLYSGKTDHWNGKSFIDKVNNYLKKQTSNPSTNGQSIPPLNPI